MISSCFIDLKTMKDSRGSLTVVEGDQDIPFEIKRIFYMHHVSADRGGHAHIDTDQVLIPINGSLKVKLFNGKETVEYVMDDCTKGLYIPRLYFTDMYEFTPETVCLVLSSTHYDMGRSLRSMEAYMTYLKENRII
jgi:dTDP-4-dehydrorhamnose 3,5-epimerase-like enzyme